MLTIEELLFRSVAACVRELWGAECESGMIQLQKTKREFEGDITLVVFPLLRLSHRPPEQTADAVGRWIAERHPEITAYNVIKGFLNMVIHDAYYVRMLNAAATDHDFGHRHPETGSDPCLVEYSSPNTNKPLHLGHIRNNLLGYAISNILMANGIRVVKTNLVNDRGIHICKSMLAWQRWGNGETPSSSGKKGDHLVGDYYVRFEREYRQQVEQLVQAGQRQEEAEKNAPLMLEAQELLRRWEAGDTEVIALWKMMNGWVYEGFDETYRRLGVDFDIVYYESDTYLHGRDAVMEGLAKGVFKRHDDGSVWVDLREEGLDEKVLLRSDGTSVYITQDIGTAMLRHRRFHPSRMIYVVGNEQNYHFRVLALVLGRLGFPWAASLHHLSYGMVELPEGRMKSREGTVVDADDLMDEMTETARTMSLELGKLEGLDETEKEDIYRVIGLGALKYYILKVDPVKNMTFNPSESIDFDGNTGTFIQYTHARIRSVFRKAEELGITVPREVPDRAPLNGKEREIIKLILDFPAVLRDAADTCNPSLLANYSYQLVKEYNQFYHDHSILREENKDIRSLRLVMSSTVGRVVKDAMNLLGIEMPDRM